jgi:putative integral membrane protein (TIGR02587 family)
MADARISAGQVAARDGLRGPFGIRYSPLRTMVHSEGDECELWVKELRDLARGFCGALFVALPLLYTMEMWEIARAMPSWTLLLGLVIAYVANVGYIWFEGYKPEKEDHSAWWDALVSLALGALGSAITLAAISQLDPSSQPMGVIAKIILIETVPTSFGASLAINQLGGRQVRGQKPEGQPADSWPQDVRKIVATVLGGLFFAFNIAPTVEPRLITLTMDWGHTLALLLFSLFVSYLMVAFADFVERGSHKGVLGPVWLETLVAYLLSLTVSAGLLWAFGYISGSTPFPLIVASIVTLGYVTTLGGSAGRLIL